MWSSWCLCRVPSKRFLVDSSASTTQASFVLRFPIRRWASPLLFIGILQSIAAGIGTSNFLRAAFSVSLNSSSFGSMKKIPLNCPALSSFGFSKAHLCFGFFRCIGHKFPHIWPYIIRTRSFLFPWQSPPRPYVSSSGGLSLSRTNLANPDRGEEQEILQGKSDEVHPPTLLEEDSTQDDEEAKNDFWSITGDFIYRHHVEPRVKLYMAREESFPFPLKYIDVTRTTCTSLDVLITGTWIERENYQMQGQASRDPFH